MTNPTGDALIARIKELEEALRPFAEIDIPYPESWIGDELLSSHEWLMDNVTINDLKHAKKALNGNNS